MRYDNCQMCNKPKPLSPKGKPCYDKPLCKSCSRKKHGLSYMRSYHAYRDLRRRGIDTTFEEVKSNHEQNKVYSHRYNRWVNRGDDNRATAVASGGYVGVYHNKRRDTYYWDMKVYGKRHFSQQFKSAYEAAADRDKYILKNNIVATLSLDTL